MSTTPTLFALITAADFVTVDGYRIEQINVGAFLTLDENVMRLEDEDENTFFLRDMAINPDAFGSVQVQAFDAEGDALPEPINIELEVTVPLTLKEYLSRQDVITNAPGG